MRILHLRAENVKRLRAVDVTVDPNDPVIVVGGRNGAGKSSVLDAIWLALAGRKASKETPMPVRNGQDRAEVELVLDGMVVRRTWRADGDSTLTVKNADGTTAKSPQALLDGMLGAVAFDPLAFARARPDEQRRMLFAAIGRTDELETILAERKALYDTRTDVAREARNLGQRLDKWEVPEPETDVTVDAAREAVRRAEALSVEHRRLCDEVRNTQAALDITNTSLDATHRVIADLEDQIARARAHRLELVDERTARTNARNDARNACDAFTDPRPAVEAAAVVLEQALRAEGARADAARYREAMTELVEHSTRSSQLTQQIDKLDMARQAILFDAKLPVDGLDVTEDGITVNGVPFEQASAAEKIRLSTRIAMASNPELRVMRIMDGSLLDDDSMAEIASFAAVYDMQIWIERVGTVDATIVIEDGSVVP